MAFIDFAELKSRVSFEQVVGFLELHGKKNGNQWRSPCPACKSGGDRALVVTDGKGYYCFGDNKGGDQIALVAHVKGVSVKDAAAQLAHFAGIRTGTSTSSTGKSKSTVPESESGQESSRTFQPLPYLEAEHPAVDAIGFDPEFAKTVGIGYAGKGILRGTVAIPVRDENGELLGYIGIQEAKLPPSFTTNVVAFPKTA